MVAPPDTDKFNPDDAAAVDALYDELKQDADVMRVLFALRHTGWAPNLSEFTTAQAREEAVDRGLVERPAILRTELFLNYKGLQALENWRKALDLALREDRFQRLLRHVIAW